MFPVIKIGRNNKRTLYGMCTIQGRRWRRCPSYKSAARPSLHACASFVKCSPTPGHSAAQQENCFKTSCQYLQSSSGDCAHFTPPLGLKCCQRRHVFVTRWFLAFLMSPAQKARQDTRQGISLWMTERTLELSSSAVLLTDLPDLQSCFWRTFS